MNAAAAQQSANVLPDKVTRERLIWVVDGRRGGLGWRYDPLEGPPVTP